MLQLIAGLNTLLVVATTSSETTNKVKTTTNEAYTTSEGTTSEGTTTDWKTTTGTKPGETSEPAPTTTATTTIATTTRATTDLEVATTTTKPSEIVAGVSVDQPLDSQLGEEPSHPDPESFRQDLDYELRETFPNAGNDSISRQGSAQQNATGSAQRGSAQQIVTFENNSRNISRIFMNSFEKCKLISMVVHVLSLLIISYN